MIILYRSTDNAFEVQPVVILDYTRSDEQWTQDEIKAFVKTCKPDISPVAANPPSESSLVSAFGLFGATFTPQILEPKIYSLDYSMTYTHQGVSYGDSLKTSFIANIKNAPMELIGLLNIRQYTSQQNIDALKLAIGNVIDPQVLFPSGAFVINDGKITIYRKFIIFSTPFNFDARRVNSSLTLKGGAFDSMVIRLQFACDIKKDEPLIEQIAGQLTKQGYTTVTFPISLASRMPAVAKYYDPAPLDTILGQICLDNNLLFDRENKSILFQSTSPDAPPPPDNIEKFSFANYVPGSKMISTFSLNNYASCEFEAEISDVKLYSSVAVYDDSLTSLKENGGKEASLFANLTKLASAPINKIDGYRFYIQEYSYFDSRDKTSMTIKGTNNWLVSNFKLDTLLENAIYKNELNK